MNRNLALAALLLLLLSSVASATINLTFYYGKGCPHCSRTFNTLFNLTRSYDLSIEGREVYYIPVNRQEMYDAYLKFGLDPADSGVPTTLVENRSLVIGEVGRERWQEIFGYCLNGGCKEGVFTDKSFSPMQELDKSKQVTLAVLIGAALVDSISPCTIAVMVMLLGVILVSSGKNRMLISGLAFAGTIFVMYFLMGLGIFRAVAGTEMANAFYLLVTIAAFILAILEIRAYFQYQPGFLAVETPLFLRPHLSRAMEGATSLPGVVVAALLCSVFLLPCSSGPYLMVLGALAKSVTAQAVMYLLIYNLVFISPMVFIALVIYLGRSNAERVNELREAFIREIHLISGLILLVLFLLMAQQILQLG